MIVPVLFGLASAALTMVGTNAGDAATCAVASPLALVCPLVGAPGCAQGFSPPGGDMTPRIRRARLSTVRGATSIDVRPNQVIAPSGPSASSAVLA